MLQTLTGRLKWERIGDEIRVVIPASLSWSVIRRLMQDLGINFLAFFGILVIVSCIAYVHGLSFSSYLESEAVRSLYIASLGCCAGLVLARMVPRLFGKTTITLSPAQITIESSSRIQRSKEVIPNSILHSFRFVDQAGAVPVQNWLKQSEIRFEQANRTRHFAEGVTREEADAIIAKMMVVFPFPKYRNTQFATGAEARQNIALSSGFSIPKHPPAVEIPESPYEPCRRG